MLRECGKSGATRPAGDHPRGPGGTSAALFLFPGFVMLTERLLTEVKSSQAVGSSCWATRLRGDHPDAHLFGIFLVELNKNHISLLFFLRLIFR